MICFNTHLISPNYCLSPSDPPHRHRSYYSKAEYAVIWVIVIASVALGSFAAIGIGIALAILIFVVRYSSSPFVRMVRHAEPAARGGNGAASPSAWTRSVSEYVHQCSAEIAV